MQLSLCPGQVRVSLSGSSLCPDRHSSGPITISIIKFLSALRYEEAPFIRPRQQAFAINIAFYDFAPSHMSNQRQSLLAPPLLLPLETLSSKECPLRTKRYFKG
ncbi:hypothetical protein AVEN_12101-1 [Araneus ventricosus]|uniref:Uncharacterized protein n=1 Tax=Araneus ventricosus TaxID=182803 RepID=A0A4Y2KEU2_ARAVE|nr:hypothetical protein AVEN_12101-1 [Araneus ventricosus]